MPVSLLSVGIYRLGGAASAGSLWIDKVKIRNFQAFVT
jgi:hypothetical protein